MKKKHILIVILIFIILSYLTYENTTTFDKIAKIEIKNTDYNFGKITSNDTINYTFNIKNISNTPLVINKILPSCTCTVVDFIYPRVFRENEIAQIKTQFIPKKDQKGKIENVILVECNSNEGIIKLKLSGEVN